MPEFSSSFKLRLYSHLMSLLEERIHVAREMVQTATESRNEDTKSSAGDKYETGRAMMQQQIDMHQTELNKAEMLYNAMKVSDPGKATGHVSTGSLVVTDSGVYFISAGVGKVVFENQEIFVISPAAPVAQQLMNKKKGEMADFAGKQYKVILIC
jgi:transcription elongation GreA/GreB family factor